MIHAIALTGPTASGKTALSLRLASLCGCEIICLDSMQIYKYMDIGTAKPTKEERAVVPHHLFGFLDPDVPCSAVAYKEAALRCAEEISSRGKIPLFVGGTGLYLDTLMYSYSERVPESRTGRCALTKGAGGDRTSGADTDDKSGRTNDTNESANGATENGGSDFAGGKGGGNGDAGEVAVCDPQAMWDELMRVDPVSAAKIHKNNTRRVLRALEIYRETGKTKSEWDAENRAPDPRIDIAVLTLDFHSRDTLYKRVDERVDEMLRAGLVDEAKWLLAHGYLSPESTAAQAIGYKELLPVLFGEEELSDAVALIKQSSRRYAKRQLTWFRHVERAHRIYADREDGTLRAPDELFRDIDAALRTEGFSPAEKI